MSSNSKNLKLPFRSKGRSTWRGGDLPILNTLYVSCFASQKVLSFIQKTNNSIDSISELLIGQNLIADTETKDDATTIDMQIKCVSIDFLAESLIHHSSFVIEEENDTATQNTIINDNNNESLIVGIGTDVGKQAQTMQK